MSSSALSVISAGKDTHILHNTALGCKPATSKTDYNQELEKLAVWGFETWRVYPHHGVLKDFQK